jgi:ribosomal protein S27AE
VRLDARPSTAAQGAEASLIADLAHDHPPCLQCGAPMPLFDESRLVCGKCQAEREVKWFASPRAYERWFHWAYFDREGRPRLSRRRA